MSLQAHLGTWIQEFMVLEHGGSAGLRDEGSLSSAMARPFQTFGGEDLYPTAAAKASAILESILINHPFVDGNKRCAWVMYRLMLLNGGWDVQATQDEKYEMVIAASQGLLRMEGILAWTEARLCPA